MTIPHAKTGFSVACLLLSSCLAALPAADERKPTTRDVAETDAVVLQVVFDDMLSKDNSESPAEWRGDQSRPAYISKNIGARRLNVSQVLSRFDEKKWEALTGAQLEATTQAANDLVARLDKGESLPELRSTSGRLRIYEDAGAATQPAPGRFGERASGVFLPGYSKDGRYAVVYLWFPWSGMMHSGVVTYVLERTDRGWKVLLRDFIYHV